LPAGNIIIEIVDIRERGNLVSDHHAHFPVARIGLVGATISYKTHAINSFQTGLSPRHRKTEVDFARRAYRPARRNCLGARAEGQRTGAEQFGLGEGAVLPAAEAMEEDREGDRHIDPDLTG